MVTYLTGSRKDWPEWPWVPFCQIADQFEGNNHWCQIFIHLPFHLWIALLPSWMLTIYGLVTFLPKVGLGIQWLSLCDSLTGLGYFSKNKETCSTWDQTLEATEPCTCQCFLCRPGYQELLALPLLVLLLNFTSIHELLGFKTSAWTFFLPSSCIFLSASVPHTLNCPIHPHSCPPLQLSRILTLNSFDHWARTWCQALLQERCCILSKPNLCPWRPLLEAWESVRAVGAQLVPGLWFLAPLPTWA